MGFRTHHVSAKEVQFNALTSQRYDSGSVHEGLMAKKMVDFYDFLLKINPQQPVTFNAERDITSWWNDLPIGRTHNIVVNEERQYAVAVGALPRTSDCQSGLIFFHLKDPSNPKTLGCASGDSYVQDAQCLVYRGPDRKYAGRDIYYGYNEDTLTIYAPRLGYQHAMERILVADDELDELRAAGPATSGYPITYFWDIRSLENPKQTGTFRSPGHGIDHNQFVVNGFAYQSHYGAGLRILDVRSLPRDPTGARVKEIGFFDIYPENDSLPNGGSIEFVGSWSHYPFFKSGCILVNTIERGAFILKRSH
ncbi:hypothetical protein N0V88_007870 [Collariella sp. IMI 366227]|nr:hypothetical protein N0V88_007870 [Collariella sp. IMI 366227]